MHNVGDTGMNQKIMIDYWVAVPLRVWKKLIGETE
jgi:hypothetical protein